MVKVREVLGRLIDESGRTKSEIAAELGISKQSLNQYLKRNPETIRTETLQKILDVLGYEIRVERKEP